MNIPLNIDWQQILLHLMNFAILAGGLYLLLYKPVKSFMDERTAYYKGLDDAASEKLAKAEAAEASSDERYANIDEELRIYRSTKIREADRAATAHINAAKAEGEKIIAAAKKTAESEHNRIVAEAQDDIKQLAISTTEKLFAQASASTLDKFLESVKEN